MNPSNLIKVSDVLDQINRGSDYGGHTFEKLQKAEADAIKPADLISALQSAFWDIKHPVPSSWGEHIPFMFSLVTLTKPRRFVELGVYSGASFFAACQAVQSCGLQTACVAIDSWLGDAHGGNYQADVFNTFQSSLRDFSEFAGYIRSDFSRAAERFEDGSIDLLHIDGLHTATAVQNDFDTWLPKLSDQGVVIFHDINEFRADFGVWRFWRTIRSRYPHFEFGHGHGLGVLLVGESGPLRKPVEGMNSPFVSEHTNEFLQVIFGGVGRLAWQATGSSESAGPVMRKRGFRAFLEKTKRSINKRIKTA